MGKIRAGVSFGLGGNRSTDEVFSKNKFSSKDVSSDLKNKISSMGLVRVAGNNYVCSASQDFWQVKDGKITKLVSGDEVDHGDSLESDSSEENDFLHALSNDEVEF